MKDVTQVAIGDEIYWFTVLSEPTESPLALQEDVLQRFNVPPDVLAYVSSCMSVADMERALEAGATPLPRPAEGAVAGPRPIEVALGETVILAEGAYLHRCARCTGVWMSDHPTPIRCGKRVCQQLAWRELAAPFRMMQHEGVAVTPDMIRRARGAHRKHRL
jgi:hypothetical protein